MVKWAQKGLAMLCAVFLCVMSLPIAQAEDFAEDRVIRVGFPLQGGLAQKDEYGNYDGYTYAYLQEIAQYTGWSYEFVEPENNSNEALSEMLKMLENGEIDIMGGMMKNEYTEELYGFPEREYGFRYSTLCVLESNTAVNESNLAGAKGLRIGINEKSVRIRAKIEAFCEANNIGYTFVFIDDATRLESLQSGKADVVVNNDLTTEIGTKVIARFDGSPYYFAATKGNTAVLQELNEAMRTIEQAKPTFTSTLYDKYFTTSQNEIYLSDSEEAYIASAKPVRIALPTAIRPIQFRNDENEISGVAPDVLKTISESTGLPVEIVPTADFAEGFALLASGEVDAICGMPYDYQVAQANDLIMSNSFLTAQGALIIQAGATDAPNPQRTAIVDRMQFPDFETEGYVKYPTGRACMDAVLSGEADAAYLNIYSAEYLGADAKYKNLRFILQPDLQVEFCIGVQKSADTRLISILNKGVSSLSGDPINSIIYRNSIGSKSKVTLANFIEANPFFSVILISAFFLILLGICILLLHVRKRAVKHLNVENQRYLLLSEFANEYIFEYDTVADTLTFSKKFAKLLQIPDKIEKASSRKPELLLSEDSIEMFHKITKGEAETDFEWLGRLPSGEQRWYRSTQADIRDESGRVVYVIGKLTDVQNEKEEMTHLERRALTDGLTGIYNSVATKDIINARLAALAGASALLIIDIDRFKEVNDRLGHYTGDIVLQDFAHILEVHVGRFDVAGRLGGDEFIFYLGTVHSAEQVERLCGELLQEAALEYTGDGGDRLTISISIGAALTGQSCTFAELYQAADKALYASKSKGRNCYTFVTYEPVAENKNE